MIPVIYLIICAAFALVMVSAFMALAARHEKERFNNTLTYLTTVIYAGNQELIPTNGKKWIDSWSQKHDDYLHETNLKPQRKLQLAAQWKEHMKLLDSLPIKTIVDGLPTSSLSPLPPSSFDNVFTSPPTLPTTSFPTGYSGFSGAAAPEKKQPPKPVKNPEKIAPKKKDSHKTLHPVTPKQLDLE